MVLLVIALNDVTWESWCIKSSVTWLCFQQHFHAKNNNIKLLHDWPFMKDIHRWLVEYRSQKSIMQKF